MKKNANILIVDDNELNRLLLHDFIEAMDHRPLLAEDGVQAIEMIQDAPPDMVLLDVMMPELDGPGVLKFIRGEKQFREIPVVMISAVDEINVVAKCVESGADDYLTKPFNPTLLRARVNACLEKYSFEKDRAVLLDKTLKGSIKVLTEVLSLVSPVAFGRASRMRALVSQICDQMRLKNAWEYEISAMLSQLGCITMPLEILEKRSNGFPLTKEQEEVFNSHPAIARDIIKHLPHLENVAEYIANQYGGECEDGSDASTSSTGAKILKIVSDFDDFVSSGLSPEAALRTLKSSGVQYDQKILDALTTIIVYDLRKKTALVRIDDLTSGMVLAQDVAAENGTLIVSKGQDVTPVLRFRLQNFAKTMDIPPEVKVIMLRRL